MSIFKANPDPKGEKVFYYCFLTIVIFINTRILCIWAENRQPPRGSAWATFRDNDSCAICWLMSISQVGIPNDHTGC